MNGTVLVVEDHSDTRDLLLRYLQRRGINAIGCSGARAALQLMRTQRPDAVILDEDMPEMTGIELFREMKTDPDLARIPVIFYSAHFEGDRVAAALSEGAVDWLVKGVHGLDRLTLAIETAKGKNRMN